MDTQLPEKKRRLSFFRKKIRERFNISFFQNITEGRGKTVTSYFIISWLLISTQHYFTSHLGDFNSDEPGDNIVEDYT